MGKTRTLERLAEMQPGWEVRAEPLKSWQQFDVDGGVTPPIDLLKAFYENKTEETFRHLQVI